MQFVTDFIWRSPLGLRINAQETANVMTTEDWVKIRGEQLRPVDGYYDVRITAELWETHFFDHVSLMVVDHPEDTDVFLDERFAFPPPEFVVNVTKTPQPVESVVTDAGDDVTALIRERDERYLDFFGQGDYQGITARPLHRNRPWKCVARRKLACRQRVDSAYGQLRKRGDKPGAGRFRPDRCAWKC